MKEQKAWHIHITGRVQGVGFRPAVYRLAQRRGLKGWVANTPDGVHIEVIGSKEEAGRLLKEVVDKPPPLARITSCDMKEVPFQEYSGFAIAASREGEEPRLLLSPDFGLCEACRAEMQEVGNRRYRYPFTTCTQCGPRYSIITNLPYDRPFTTMAAFQMCPSCQEEYNDPGNRRHYSQTNSCPACPVVVQLFEKGGACLEDAPEKLIRRVSDLWDSGAIIAVKGIGGYLLTCDAANEGAVKELRRRKCRPTKPLAVMFPDMAILRGAAHVSEGEEALLRSEAAPIVLLQIKREPPSALALDLIAPGLSRIGALLPYAPLFELLLHQFSRPVVATSGNVSGTPIVHTDEEAWSSLAGIADFVVVHNRAIIAAQDDSLVACTRHKGRPLLLRRGRGYAPYMDNRELPGVQDTVLATGASLKSTFSLLHRQDLHTSPYLGDTDDWDVQQRYEKTLHHYLTLFGAEPAVVLVDRHPGYFTSGLGVQLSEQWGSRLVKVPHHEAHFASVLAEHRLLEGREPVLGVVWDGAGLGRDGNIWGGEFFIFHRKQFTRVDHFNYYTHFLGDKMAREPRLSALALCPHGEAAERLLRPKFTAPEWTNYRKLVGGSALRTSSVGRIFDAVASLLGLCDKASYEGEAAMLLEREAERYFDAGLIIPPSWRNADLPAPLLSPQSIVKEIMNKVLKGEERTEIAAWFHVQLALLIKEIAAKYDCRQVCFSGGVFQNGLLTDLIQELVTDGHQLYFNRSLPSNDENISFGQLAWFCIRNAGEKDLNLEGDPAYRFPAGT